MWVHMKVKVTSILVQVVLSLPAAKLVDSAASYIACGLSTVGDAVLCSPNTDGEDAPSDFVSSSFHLKRNDAAFLATLNRAALWVQLPAPSRAIASRSSWSCTTKDQRERSPGKTRRRIRTEGRRIRTCLGVQLRLCRGTERRWPFPFRPFGRAAFVLADFGLGTVGLTVGDAVGGALTQV